MAQLDSNPPDLAQSLKFGVTMEEKVQYFAVFSTPETAKTKFHCPELNREELDHAIEITASVFGLEPKSKNISDKMKKPRLIKFSTKLKNSFTVTYLELNPYLADPFEGHGYFGFFRCSPICSDLGNYKRIKAICQRLELEPVKHLYNDQQRSKPENRGNLRFDQNPIKVMMGPLSGHFVGFYKRA